MSLVLYYDDIKDFVNNLSHKVMLNWDKFNITTINNIGNPQIITRNDDHNCVGLVFEIEGKTADDYRRQREKLVELIRQVGKELNIVIIGIESYDIFVKVYLPTI